MNQLGKFIGAGIAISALQGPAIGAGIIFQALINGESRNPELKGNLFNTSIIAFALVEAIGLLALTISLLILYS